MGDATSRGGTAFRHAAPLHTNLPGAVVLTRRDPWLIDDIAVAGLTSIVSGLASIQGLGAAGITAVAGGGVAAVAGRTTFGIWRNHSRILATQLTVTLARELDLGVRIRLHRWRGGPVSWACTRIGIRYPIERSIDAMLPSRIAELCKRVVGSDFILLHHNPARGYLLLCRVTPDREIAESEQHLVADRGSLVVRQLLGESAAVTPQFDDGGLLTALNVTHKVGVRVVNANRRAHIERTCSTMLPGRWRARWDLERDEVTFELRPTLPIRVNHKVEPVTDENYWKLPYATDEDGNTIYWDLASSSPHHMVSGKSGTGKTVEIRTIMTEATRPERAWPVWVVDPKRVEFMNMRDWPNVQIVATRVVEMVAVIMLAWREMEDRYARIERREVKPSELRPLILILDEYRDFFGMVTAWWQQVKNVGHSARCPVFEAVSSLARKGRTARVHMELGTQRPDAEFLTGEMRDNFDSRSSLGSLSPQGAQMMWEAPYIGVAIPRKIRGRGTAMDSEGRPVECQVWWTPEPGAAEDEGNVEDLAILEALRASEATHGRMAVQLDEEWLHEDRADKNGRLRLWDAIQNCALVEYDEAAPLQHQVFGDIADLAGSPAAPTEPAPAEADADLVDDAALDAEYDQPVDVRADDVREGDLIEVDDAWVMVEAAIPDPVNGSGILIDWRSFSDERGSLVSSDEEHVQIRRPFDDVDNIQEIVGDNPDGAQRAVGADGGVGPGVTEVDGDNGIGGNGVGGESADR